MSWDESPVVRVDEAMRMTPRTAHLPADQQARAALDRALPIGHGQTCSQPTTVRNMLLALDVQPGQRVLDLGAGSGWTTAILARLVGPSGSVLGVERVPALAAWGAAHVAAAGLPWATIVRAAPGVLGAPAQGPFDRILVSAEARTVPEALVAQLAEGGVMVAPVAGELLRIRYGARTVERLGRYLFVPLVEDPGP